MKTELKAKYIQYLNQKKQDEGFTLIELLVVIIIIGILAAIALPSFLNQANKAKQSEAKTYVGSMNRSQQAYYLENDKFVKEATEFGQLGLGIATETKNYKYSTDGGGQTDVTNKAQTVQANAPLKAYLGGVVLGVIQQTSEATTLAKLCEGEKAVGIGGDNATGTIANNPPTCPAGYKDLSGNTTTP